MNIDQIKVGFRYRKDLGDLRSLAQSIEEVGLLHPVVVTPEGRLIAGQRRLEAFRLIGRTDVPVTVVDLYQAARGEAHENFVRKDLLPSEIVLSSEPSSPLNAGKRDSGRGNGRTSVIPPLWRNVRGPNPVTSATGSPAILVSAEQQLTGLKPWSRRPRKNHRNAVTLSSKWTVAAKWQAPIGAWRF